MGRELSHISQGRYPLALQLTLGPSSRLCVASSMQRPQVEKTEAAGCLLFVNLDLIPKHWSQGFEAPQGTGEC